MFLDAHELSRTRNIAPVFSVTHIFLSIILKSWAMCIEIAYTVHNGAYIWMTDNLTLLCGGVSWKKNIFIPNYKQQNYIMSKYIRFGMSS